MGGTEFLHIMEMVAARGAREQVSLLAPALTSVKLVGSFCTSPVFCASPAPDGPEPPTLSLALKQLPSVPTATRRRRRAGKGLSFKSMSSAVIRISYRRCHCNGWD